MSAMRNIDFDSQSPLQFHRYVDLPSELRITVIQDFIAILRLERILSLLKMGKRLPSFALFAAVHSEWQYEFEAEKDLFGTLALSTNDLPTFHQVLNQRRRKVLSEVTLRVCINNTTVGFNRRANHDNIENAATLSRARRLVVSSVIAILENVENAINAGSQETKSDLVLHTDLKIPGDKDHRRLVEVLLRADGIDCDFSQLRPAYGIRRFSQLARRDFDRWEGLDIPRSLALSPSAILTLASRMPSLEEADIVIPGKASVEGINSLPLNACPRLKALSAMDFFERPEWHNLARWASCWGNKIENIDLVTDNIPLFMSRFIQDENHSEAIKWPDLQEVSIWGYCDARRASTPTDIWMASAGPYNTLLAVAMTLARLPSLRHVTFHLSIKLGPDLGDGLFHMTIELHLSSGSRNLTISGPRPYAHDDERRLFNHLVQSGSNESNDSNDLSFRDYMQLAGAEVQAAARMHRGHELNIVVRDEEPLPQGMGDSSMN